MSETTRQSTVGGATTGRSACAAAVVSSVAMLLVGLSIASPASAQECPPWKAGGEHTGRIQSDHLGESSGLASSRRHDGLFWTHNDSGNGTRLFLYRPDGAVVAEGRVEGAKTVDWEDMAIAPCTPKSSPKDPEQCIYLADIGDNSENRDTVEILKFPEPDVPDDQPASVTIDDWKRIEFEYEDGPRDAETVMVHPETAKIYVIQKNNDVEAPVYRVPNRPTGDSEPRTAKKFTELRIAKGLGRQVTGGDISPDGREFSIRTYVKIYTYCAESEEPFETAFSASPVISQPRLTIQSEALAYDALEDAIWFTSEGKNPPMIRMERAPVGSDGNERGELEDPEPASTQADRETGD